MKPGLNHLKCTACAIGFILSVLVGNVQAQQVPIPQTPAEVSGPAPGTMTKAYVQMVGRMAYFWGWPLALLWQIYSCRCLLQIHFRQCGHRRGGSRAMSSRMAWRTAGRVGWGGGPLILFFPPCCCEAAMLEEGVRDHRHERMTV
jgi:hypothetical protein